MIQTAASCEYSAVVVTGAAGWFGQNLVRALRDGLPDCADLAQPPFADVPLHLADIADIPAAEDARVTRHRVDITRPEDCARLFAGLPPKALTLHCAGLIHPRKISELHAVNTQGTINIFNAAADAGAARVIALSSNSPCGCNAGRNGRFNEDSPYAPYMAYGRSKMLMEQHVRALPADAPAWTLIRAPWFYGPHQPPRQTLFFNMIRNGKGPVVGGGDGYRSMAYSDNLAQGMLRAALTAAAARKIYWIADAEPYTMNQVIDTVERLLEEEFNLPCRRARLRLPGPAADIAFCADWLLQRAGRYHQKIHVLSEMNKTIACDISRAGQELGYAPAVALEEGMRRSIRDALERGHAI